ncbi:heavy-metal-associated domain-containing protein [Anaeroselena agilis]|uniref:Heavy-metal-associated domain-containing protein n=1 Tax=Anaeroselena agilis TaxID=3063788 RepID=A0ABU3NTJ5_9FIRM|nr:heavy-metal-associated domain-containing protein [Selenomonadales bacterium 4137-cl]
MDEKNPSGNKCLIMKRLRYQKLLKEAGFENDEDFVDVCFHIEGFDCLPCAAKIEDALHKLDKVEIKGIEFVAKVKVKFDRTRLLTADISEVVQGQFGDGCIKRLVL